MKDKFITSTIILLIGGLLTKILGMIIKIIMARVLGTKGMGLYMLILPTFILLINLSQFGLPLALSKLISENTKSSKKLFFSILPIIIIINLSLMIIIILLAPIISNKLLHNKDTYLSIIAISFVIPFTSISSICRSYFFGKQQMLPHVLSNITEDIVRLILIITIIPNIINKGINITVFIIILLNIISELSSTIILIMFLPKNVKITKEDLKPKKQYIKESLKISIPNTSSRLIGSIGFFLEPIILTSILLKNYSINYITTEYGIISGFVIPLILLPSFASNAISSALLPTISKDYANNNIKSIKRKCKLAISYSLVIGLPITIILCLFPTFFLKTIYHTTKGTNYIRILAPFCLLEYLESPLSTIMDATGNSKINLIATIISTFSRSISLIIFSVLKIGIYSLIIAIIINIILTSTYLYITYKKLIY